MGAMVTDPAMKTIVVGFDGSEGAERALDRAITFAKAFGAKLVVTVVERLLVSEITPLTISEPPSAGWEREAHLERARALVAEQGIAFELVSPMGPPAVEIVNVADDRNADLIVVGTHEPGLIERLFSGSVSGSVARMAHCDVLVVHPHRPSP
jgi:nucleotide-binding universal stress UspA family protein